MGVFDFVKNGVREMMIARPDNFKSLIVYKHPDQNFPMYSQLTVDSDECAVFFKDGRVVGVLPPGRHTLQTQNIPFLNAIVNNFTGGQVFISEIFFVKTTPVRGVPFGGPIGTMRDPQLMCIVTPRIFGEMSVVVTDPVQFIIGYVGAGRRRRQRADPRVDQGPVHERREADARRVLREAEGHPASTRSPTRAISRRRSSTHVPGADRRRRSRPADRRLQHQLRSRGRSRSSTTRTSASSRRSPRRSATSRSRRSASARRAAVAQQNQFALDQKYAQDARYVQNLAGNYSNYAAGQAMMGAGQGMAEHGVGGGGIAGMGAQMAVGAAMGQGMAGAMPQYAVPAPRRAQPPSRSSRPAGAEVTCGKCQTQAAGREVLRRVRDRARPVQEVLHGLRQRARGRRRSSARTAGRPRPPRPETRPAPSGPALGFEACSVRRSCSASRACRSSRAAPAPELRRRGRVPQRPQRALYARLRLLERAHVRQRRVHRAREDAVPGRRGRRREGRRGR